MKEHSICFKRMLVYKNLLKKIKSNHWFTNWLGFWTDIPDCFRYKDNTEKKLYLCYNPPRVNENVPVYSTFWDRCLFPYPHRHSPCRPGMLLYYQLSCVASPPGPEPAYVPGTWWHVPPEPSSSPAPGSWAWGSRTVDCACTQERKCFCYVALSHLGYTRGIGKLGSRSCLRHLMIAARSIVPATEKCSVLTLSARRNSKDLKNFAMYSRNVVQSEARKRCQ